MVRLVRVNCPPNNGEIYGRIALASSDLTQVALRGEPDLVQGLIKATAAIAVTIGAVYLIDKALHEIDHDLL